MVLGKDFVNIPQWIRTNIPAQARLEYLFSYLSVYAPWSLVCIGLVFY